MSSYGFSVVNDANELVVDANSIGYGYVGRAQLVSAGVKLYREVTPYRFSCVMPSSSDLPIAAIVVNDTSVVRLHAITRAPGDPSGRTWYIDVFSVAWDTAASSNTQPVQPQVLVFAPMASMGQAWGIQIFRPDGVTVAWDFSVRPLWIRQILVYGQQQGGYTYEGGNQNMGYFDGDSAGRDTSISVPAVIGAGNASYSQIQDSSGEYLQAGEYGWRLIGASLARRRMWRASDRPDAEPTPFDSLSFNLWPARAVLIDSSGLN